MLTELRSEKFEWFGPSPIEPFNLGGVRAPSRWRGQGRGEVRRRDAVAHGGGEQSPGRGVRTSWIWREHERGASRPARRHTLARRGPERSPGQR